MSTPLADALHATAGRATRRGGTGNLHALPWQGLVFGSDHALRQAYRRLFGRALARTDGSWSGPALDSFFRPQGPLAAAQRLAAEAFGADATFFGSCGTTTTNRVALDVLRARSGARPTLLADPTSHQSVLLNAEGWTVTTAPAAGGRLDPQATARELARRAELGRPYDALAITATAYDGALLRLGAVLPELIRASPTTALLIDEAWSAVHAFVPGLAHGTALAVARGLAGAPVLVAQSAHKTMGALRQGSYLHVLAGDGSAPALIDHVHRALLRGHTSSPSWPVLASLDLARAHAARHGAAAFARACALREQVVAALDKDPKTAGIPVPFDGEPGASDPAALLLDVGHLADPAAVRAWLWQRHGLHLPPAGTRLVARFHLGVSRADARTLLIALRALAAGRGPASAPARPVPATIAALVPGSATMGYVISYPPGVPMARPGEPWTAELATEAAERTRGGAEIFHVPGPIAG